ncbi:hypothetical protein D5F01_LYC10885 [Larimichthys crocea]|uniref:Fibronectin type-III domain-containing protein n=1 Tax=Larimichthys crocea TaxID=215358 RepID=A0A6G0IIA5_LARCR|nr:uncharacterized protein LOC109138066 [Larimichthys crocea]KAE8291288.1 hypothetical protein D5F01_LYC10885 [Larimichthys crocea]
MKLFPVHSILWSSLLLVLLASQSGTDASNPDVCQDTRSYGSLERNSSKPVDHHTEIVKKIEDVVCRLYPTNKLNCSWPSILQEDIQLSVFISICDDKKAVFNFSSVDKGGPVSLTLLEQEISDVLILQLNVTQHDRWTAVIHTVKMSELEVLPPPTNISASVRDGSLTVKWSLPHSRETNDSSCFQYELDMGDQENPRQLDGEESYTEQNVDPNLTYKVRIRARKEEDCQEQPEWSDWSHTVIVEPSVHKLNIPVIISISLGIPMILLAVVLLVRYQRVSEVLFPPIPRPPPKYIYFLEKNETSNLFHTAPPTEPMEEITEVEDTEENHEKTLSN